MNKWDASTVAGAFPALLLANSNNPNMPRKSGAGCFGSPAPDFLKRNSPMRLKTLLLAILSLHSGLSLAINPSSKYSNTPLEMGLEHEEMRLRTNDGAVINVWHLPSSGPANPVIVAQSDAGNMGDWLYLGAYLQSSGADVWLFDYRGFGASSQFEVQRPFLFYLEFVDDLRAVVKQVHDTTGKSPYLMGLSMGSMVIREYLKQERLVPVAGLIFDGYVCDPHVWKERLSATGREILIPEEYSGGSGMDEPYLPCLYMVAEFDPLSKEGDIPRGASITIQRFKCAHLEAFFKYPRRYVRRIIRFMNGRL